MKKILFIACLFLGSLSSMAQEEKENGWTKEGSFGINFSQTSFTNWTAGGNSSMSGLSYFNANANYKQNQWLWQNSANLEYGLVSLKDEGSQKTADKINLNTQLGYTTDNKWYYTFMVGYNTQFYKGYDYPNKENIISNFMAPGYLNISVGMEYKPEDKWYSLYYSPLNLRMIFVKDKYLSDLGQFGVDPGKEFKAELGSYFKVKAQKDLMENVKMITDASFFTPYNKHFGNIDVEWNFMLSFKINKYLNASLNTTLKYFDAQKTFAKDGTISGPKVQFKEVLGIGLGYNF